MVQVLELAKTFSGYHVPLALRCPPAVLVEPIVANVVHPVRRAPAGDFHQLPSVQVRLGGHYRQLCTYIAARVRLRVCDLLGVAFRYHLPLEGAAVGSHKDGVARGDRAAIPCDGVLSWFGFHWLTPLVLCHNSGGVSL